MSELELDDALDDSFKIPITGTIKSTISINSKIDFSFDDEMDNFSKNIRNVGDLDSIKDCADDDELDEDLLNKN